ncbi:hypothetical protein ACFSSG_03220 [Euzebyella marina]|uniref:hypothetical protein n=1 Tax=Euzebyella marina TaxID=1761453 RepID=UPI0013CEC225|nr:hypothetical protein [Euzebyella marina]
MGIKCKYVFCLLAVAYIFSCKKKTAKSDIEIVFTQDTLQIPYTYWWDEAGPFIGYCGEPYSLVFTGVLTHLEAADEKAGPLYTSQKGVIQLEKVLYINDEIEGKYASQRYVTMDSFHQLDLKVSDKVLVFCYDYENKVTIPGDKSIIKIGDYDHPLVESTKEYIDSGQNVLEIKKDSALWAAYGYCDSFKRILRCKEDSP